MKLLLTGATGFIGSKLFNFIQNDNQFEVKGCVRMLKGSDNLNLVEIGDLSDMSDYSTALNNVDVVIHLAARAHVFNVNSLDSLSEFRKVNVDGTLHLARQAAKLNVKRFIYISSIGVVGVNSVNPFTELSNPEPHDFYSLSKYEAEIGLKSICNENGMELVIIRPPLVYGADAPGNFAKFLNLTSRRIPLPFKIINNHRSMIYVENLIDFIVKCIDHPLAANETFLISDGEDISLHTLIEFIRKSLGQPIWLFPVPSFCFQFAALLFNKKRLVDGLIGDLQVDSSKARQLLDWNPPFSVADGIAATVYDYKNRNIKCCE
ncbi:MAG: NAD-dependent epimerase/dehydratase family protein [Oleibacter sp.]|nr:NAD-dependent epimerase/dehydratase family protein [Thalassolituus sp.]